MRIKKLSRLCWQRPPWEFLTSIHTHLSPEVVEELAIHPPVHLRGEGQGTGREVNRDDKTAEGRQAGRQAGMCVSGMHVSWRQHTVLQAGRQACEWHAYDLRVM